MNTDGPVTLVEVAKAAGVSKTTASDALRNSGRVSERTRQLVTSTATRLGYSPNASAQSLRRASTGAIGLHVPDILTRSEYYMSFVFGVVDQAAEMNYDVTLITSKHVPSPGAFHRVDGVVLGDPLETDPVVRGLLGAAVPTVTCERFTGEAVPSGVVRSDHSGTFEQLLGHLRSAGARRPALLASSSTTDWGKRLQQTFRAWCGKEDLPVLMREQVFGSPAEVVRDNVRALLADDPAIDALICAPDGSAVAALPVLREAGREVGGDLLLAACVDSVPLQHSDPPITAIDLHPRAAGAACAQLLFDILAGRAPEGTERSLPIGLVERRSTTR